MTRPWLRQISNDCSKKIQLSNGGNVSKENLPEWDPNYGCVYIKSNLVDFYPGTIFHSIDLVLSHAKVHSLLPMSQNSQPISCINKVLTYTRTYKDSTYCYRRQWENVSDRRYSNLQDLCVFVETHQLLLL